MEDQYGISDLRQYINGRSIFQPIVQPPDLLSGHGILTPVLQQYPDQMNLVGRRMTEMVPPGDGFHQEFRTDHSATTGVSVTFGLSSGGGCFSGLEMDTGGFGAGDGGTGRWPRQETLTLLEIRSMLDSKFKEANHKGPLWDEVSRIMSEEHGYQRSGKKCREKFENLFKYYKKTKDGKAGRQDGKHYRFFRQLEALYGEPSNTSSFSNNHLISSAFPYHNASLAPNQESLHTSKIADSLSLSNSSDFYSTSSEDVTVENDSCEKRRKRKGKKNWKAKITDFIDLQMKKIKEKQEIWLEKMMTNIEEKEKERIEREEEWRKQESERIEAEQKFWANERAWIEARDASLMESLRKVTGKGISSYNHHSQEGVLESVSVPTSVTKRDSINEYLILNSGKKRKEDSRTCCYVMNESVSSMENGSYSCSGNEQWDGTLRHEPSELHGPPPADGGGGGSAMPYGGYRYLLGDAGNLWMNNGVKFSKGENC